ncbi:MAG: hypothetical protein ABIZ49_00005, partial [Opitutaceae bacterium]
DHELPTVKSEQFMHALRTLQPGIAIGFVCSQLTPELIARLSRHRVAGIFSKPANPKLLLERIAQALKPDPKDSLTAPANSETPRSDASDSPRGFDSIAVWAASAAPFPAAGANRRSASAAASTGAQRTGTNPPLLASKSLFRPGSKNYNFGKRLAESIAVADAHGGS